MLRESILARCAACYSSKFGMVVHGGSSRDQLDVLGIAALFPELSGLTPRLREDFVELLVAQHDESGCIAEDIAKLLRLVHELDRHSTWLQAKRDALELWMVSGSDALLDEASARGDRVA